MPFTSAHSLLLLPSIPFLPSFLQMHFIWPANSLTRLASPSIRPVMVPESQRPAIPAAGWLTQTPADDWWSYRPSLPERNALVVPSCWRFAVGKRALQHLFNLFARIRFALFCSLFLLCHERCDAVRASMRACLLSFRHLDGGGDGDDETWFQYWPPFHQCYVSITPMLCRQYI